MKNTLIVFFFLIAAFQSKASDTTTVVLNDTVLSSVYYHKVNFLTPTRLVFPNLRRVTGEVYFHQNVNLISVDFPLLDSCGSIFYFQQNLSLKMLTALNLHTVKRYLYIGGNANLTEMNICNLQQILPEDNDQIPYYYVENNTPVVDQKPMCFSKGGPQNLQLLNNNISENKPPNSLVGSLSVSHHATDSIHYYLTTDSIDNREFRIQGNQLFSASTFNYEAKNEFNLRIGAFNLLGESTFLSVKVNVADVVEADTAIVVISDTVLSSVYYYKISYLTPTKLVFPNLRRVTGEVYFHQNVNLISVDFPLLDSCGSIFYFHQNLSLKMLTALNLHTVKRYLYIGGNTTLTEMNICNLQQILPEDNDQIPYYYVENNTPVVDQKPMCFSKGGPQNLQLLNNNISENKPPNSLVGSLSVSHHATDSIHYYLTTDSIDNREFRIQGNQLFSASTFNYEAKNEYNLRIGAFNLLGESTFLSVKVNVADVVEADTAIVVISDTVLSGVYYYKISYLTPTKLVFPNLRRVTGDIYFQQNANLASVDFPLLDSCGGSFSFHQNLSLKKLTAPNLHIVTRHVYFHQNNSIASVDFPLLESCGSYFYFSGNLALNKLKASNLHTIKGYLYIEGNKSLVDIDVCNLRQILPEDNNQLPYYYVENNTPLVDQKPMCFSKGGPQNLLLLNNTISQDLPPNSVVGKLEVTRHAGDSIHYYLTDREIDNHDFRIKGNQLLTAVTFDYEVKNEYSLHIGAYNLLGEKTFLDVKVKVASLNTWTGAGISPATSAWENPANWNMGMVPDGNTDVVINGGNIIIGTNVICRTLILKSGAIITVKPGYTLTVIH